MRKALATVTLLATAATSAAACSAPGSAEPAEEGLTQVQVTYSNPTLFTTDLPIYVAEEMGFFEDAGLQVEQIVTGGGSEAVQAVVAGSADIAVETGATAAIGAYGSGAPIKIVGASHTGLDIIWYTQPDSGITDLADLAGRRVGYSTEGSSTHAGVLAINEQLLSEGLEPLQPTAIGGPPDALTALQTDQIDAGWTTPPTFLDMIQNGELTVVVEGSDIAAYQDVAVRVIIGNAPWLEQNPEAAEAFMEVWDQSWDWIFENPEEATEIWKETAGLELPQEVLLSAYDYYERENTEAGPLNGRDVLIQDAVENGFIEEPLTDEQINELFDDSYLPE